MTKWEIIDILNIGKNISLEVPLVAKTIIIYSLTHFKLTLAIYIFYVKIYRAVTIPYL